MNWPEMPATWLMPIAMPRWLNGNASVRMAGELAISIAPPTACRIRQPISHSAPDGPVNGSNGQRERAEREDREAEVVHPDPAVDVTEAAERHHQDGRDDQVAHQHPEQVADVARGQRIRAGCRGRWPGSEMITIEAFTVADSMPSVVLDSATHL